MKIAIVLGTRPEIIKMSPIVRECGRLGVSYFVLHTGQHYSSYMDKVFFDRLQLPNPKYNLGIGSGTHAEETSKAIVGIERILLTEKPSIVLVEGDTNTVLAGALAATKLGVQLGHVEAGLRSYDRRMPEEINRVITDHISDYLFAPTKRSKENLLREGIEARKIHVVGNTIVDSMRQNASLISGNYKDGSLEEKPYLLLTLHRQENVDDRKKFENILAGLQLIYEKFGFPIVYPIHPRTAKRMNEFNLAPSKGLSLIEPVDYLTFLRLESKAALILTDSGGVQEEACVLKVPCVTLRDNTERPETIEVGANTLAGTVPKEMLAKTEFMLHAPTTWGNPFGDGSAAKQIMNIISKDLKDL